MSGKQTVDLEEVVNEHQGLVKSIVKRFSVSAFDQDDLMQAGFMGLIDAFKRFNPEKGYAFSTYATPFILGAIKK
ncbi:MAG: sigma-70 family RNA polymerase sigma factor, partial [Bacilli bacterium]